MKRLLVVLFVSLGLMAGCGGGASIGVSLSPAAEGIDLGQRVTVAATVTNDSSNSGVTWSCTGAACPGSLPAAGTDSFTFTPGASGTAMFTASSVHQPSITKSVTITVSADPSLHTAALPGGIVGTAYTGGQIAATGGTSPLSYSVSSGSLPAGLVLNSSSGAITGTPTGPASTTPVSFTVKVTDSSAVAPQSATQALSITISQAPAITSANQATFVVNTAGSFTVKATGVPTPAITEAGALPSGVTFKDNGNGTGTLAGTPTGTPGNYPVTFTASNGVGKAAVQSFTLTVGQAPAITSANATTFTAGSAGTFTVTTTGFPKPTLSESGALPSGVTFTDKGNGTATLSGTAASGSGGKYTLTITASNGIGSNATQTFTLTVNATPVITSANKVTFTVLTPGTFQVTTSGYPTPSIAESGKLPTGVTFVDNKNGTGTLAGTPATGTAGSYPITFTPSNGIGSPVAQKFTFTVGQAPAITSANTATFTAGSAGTFTVTTSGFPTPALSESGALPSGVTFKDNGDGTATLSGTPGSTTGGSYPITITASNGIGSKATQNFTLTVNQAPSITSANSTTFSVGGAGTFTVTTSGYPKPSLTETGNLPNGVSFVDNGGGTATLSGTPTSGTNGTYSISFTAHNGIGSDATQIFTLTVNTAPVFTSANTTSFTAGASGSFTVTTSGTPTPSLSITSGSLPKNLTFTDNGDGTGTLSGMPAAGTGGTYPITFKATNTAGSNTQNFTLTVDQAPAITSVNSTTFTEGASSSFTVTTSGFPAPSLSETGTLPSGVSFVDNGGGTATLSGTPAAGTSSSSPYSITITAHNGVGLDATQSFTLNINSAPAFTTSTSTTFTVGTSGSFTFTATGNPAPTISETGTLPSGVTFTGGTSSGTLSGTPKTGTGGVYNITVKAQSTSGTTTQNFTLTVDEAPGFSSSASTTFYLSGTNSFTVQTTGYPQSSMTITETGALPSGVSFTDNKDGSGTLTGTPSTTTGSPWTITFTAANGVGTAAVQTFTLTVSAAAPCGSGSESLLNGHYAFMLKGFDSSGNPALIGGVVTLNGSGGITAGTMDVNLSGGVQTGASLTGTYQIGSDHRGCMKITPSGGTVQDYRFSLGGISSGVASTGHMIDFDASGPFTTGELLKQDTAAFSTSVVTGNFAFGFSSAQNSAQTNDNGTPGGKFAAVGVFNLSTGAVSGGEVDYNQSGELDGNTTITAWPSSPGTINSGGTYTIDGTTGRGTLTFTPSGGNSGPVPNVIYVVSSTQFLVLSTSTQTTDVIYAGTALKQASGPFASSWLSGTGVYYESALGGGGTGTTRAQIGLISGSGNTGSSGNFTNTFYQNDSGNFLSVSNVAGTFTVNSSSGRVLTAGTGAGHHPPVLYVVGTNEAFMLDSNGVVNGGFLQPQSGTFSTSSVKGTAAFGAINPEDPAVSDTEGVITLDGASTITGTSDDDSAGSLNPGLTLNQGYAVSSSGLGQSSATCTILANSTTCNSLFLFITPTKMIEMDSGSTNTHPAIIAGGQ